MKKAQRQVDRWVKKHKIGYFKPLEILARLTEEVGELAREINHNFGPKRKKASEKTKEIGDEMGDIIFTLACLANSLGMDMDKSFGNVMKKIQKRDKNRYEKK
jgi:NTP pyrophosphatase (non-canonical NTP hydrolase)